MAVILTLKSFEPFIIFDLPETPIEPTFLASPSYARRCFFSPTGC